MPGPAVLGLIAMASLFGHRQLRGGFDSAGRTPGQFCMWVAVAVITLTEFRVASASGNSPGMPPVRDFFRDAAVMSVKISPDGDYLTTVFRADKPGAVANLMLTRTDGSTPPRYLSNRTYGDIGLQLWATPQTILFQHKISQYSPRGTQWRGGLYVVDRQTGKQRELTSLRQYRLAGAPARDDGRILVWLYGNYDLTPSAGWLDLEEGRVINAIAAEPGVVGWYADYRQQIRVSMLAGDAAGPGRLALRYRDSEDATWQPAYPLQQGASDFQGFDQDGRHLWVLAPHGDRTALFRLDPMAGDLGEPVVSDPLYDIEGLLLQDDKGRELEIRYDADRPTRIVFDPDWQRHYAQIDQLLPETFNGIVSWDDAETRLVVLARGDRYPGAYYLYDTRRQQLDFVVAVAPWLHREQLARMEPITLAARDGLTLHGYFTPPVGHHAGPAPMVVMPHGGPFGIRDTWGFDPETQFLANLGYAVLQINFRGSSGYGSAFEQAGYGQWGLAMQDDLSDAVAWAVATGRADPTRVAIFGASYGGYAALMGLIKTPELYRCGIAFAAITDRRLLYRNDRLRFGDAGEDGFKTLFGDPDADPELFDATSPFRQVDRIQVPVLLAHGQVDGVVDIRHFRLMRHRLRRNGNEFESFERRYEGHSLAEENNRVAFFETMRDFLARHIPTPRNSLPTAH